MLVTRSEHSLSPSISRHHPVRTPIVIVLGMHRSGTSLCSQVLSLFGLDMADEVTQSPSNQAGHWERWEVVEFHDRVLRLLDRDYWSWTHDFPLPSGWWAQPEIRAIQRELEDFIRTRMRPGHPFGFKDPRTARLLPLWTPIFRALNLDPRFVFCVRSPSQVARSLNDRDGLPLPTGEYRWAVYNAECWRHLRAEPCTIVYDSWFTDLDQTLDRLLTFLSDVIDVDRASIAQALETRIDRSLRHDGLAPKSAQQPALRYFYELLSIPDKTSATQVAIARFVEQFTAFQQILPYEGRVKAAEELEAAQTAGGERIRALVAEQEQQAAELDVLRTSLDQARMEAQTARQESESWRAQHDAAMQARDEAIAEAERHARDTETARRDYKAQGIRHAAAISEAEAEIRRLCDAHASLHQWVAAFQNGIASSWSWRLTRPLRRVGFARAVLPPHPDHIDS